jgi:hypothetical protein
MHPRRIALRPARCKRAMLTITLWVLQFYLVYYVFPRHIKHFHCPMHTFMARVTHPHEFFGMFQCITQSSITPCIYRVGFPAHGVAYKTVFGFTYITFCSEEFVEFFSRFFPPRIRRLWVSFIFIHCITDTRGVEPPLSGLKVPSAKPLHYVPNPFGRS